MFLGDRVRRKSNGNFAASYDLVEAARTIHAFCIQHLGILASQELSFSELTNIHRLLSRGHDHDMYTQLSISSLSSIYLKLKRKEGLYAF